MGKGKKKPQQQMCSAGGGASAAEPGLIEQLRGNAAALAEMGENVIDAVDEVIPDVRSPEETPAWADWMLEAPESSLEEGGACMVGDTEHSKKKVRRGKKYTNDKKNDDGEIKLRVDFARKLEVIVRGEAVSTDGTLDEASICALMAWQERNGLKADGKLGPSTRELLEQHMGHDETSLLGRYTQPRLLVPAGAGGASRFNFYKKLVQEAGGYFDETPGQVNVIGIRGAVFDEDGNIRQNDSAQKEASGEKGHKHFDGSVIDDLLVSVWIGESGPQVQERRGTVNPNLYWSTDEANKRKDTEGTSHIRDGQYVYEMGTHNTSHHDEEMEEYLDHGSGEDATEAQREEGDRRRGVLAANYDPVTGREDEKRVRYKALNPVSLEIIRESADSDDHEISEAEYQESLDRIRHRDRRYTDPDGIDTNVHSSPDDKASSLGCPNIPLNEGYVDFIEEIEDGHEKTGRNTVLFTVIDASKIQPVDQGSFEV